MKTAIKDLGVLAQACRTLGIPYTQGNQTIDLYERPVQGDFSFRLRDWTYPVVVNSQTGEMQFDNFKGNWGDEKELNKLIQEYSLSVAEGQLEEFRLKGWNIERQKQENGDIQLVATQ